MLLKTTAAVSRLGGTTQMMVDDFNQNIISEASDERTRHTEKYAYLGTYRLAPHNPKA